MPLTMVELNKPYTISRVGGQAEVRKHLADLGCVPGVEVSVVSELAGNLILTIRESRVAIDHDLAMKIFV